MIKARCNTVQFEIYFWELLFWLMKVLQFFRDAWMAITRSINPVVFHYMVLFFGTSALGLGLGFSIGVLRAYFMGG